MKTVVQRVVSAAVSVDGKCVGSINNGLLIFVGIRVDDTKECAEWMANKIKKLRIFEDDSGKMNLSATDMGYEYLIISQFTLYGDCVKGTRPSFTKSAPPDTAIPLYEYFIELMRQESAKVETGIFGADMRILADNDGPVTVILEKNSSDID